MSWEGGHRLVAKPGTIIDVTTRARGEGGLPEPRGQRFAPSRDPSAATQDAHFLDARQANEGHHRPSERESRRTLKPGTRFGPALGRASAGRGGREIRGTPRDVNKSPEHDTQASQPHSKLAAKKDSDDDDWLGAIKYKPPPK